MCFSATASLSAAAVLGSAGIVTLSRTASARELPLAGVPALFAIQQVIEGALWLALPHQDEAGRALVLANGFALIALVVWPVYAPVAVMLVESAYGRRAVIALTLVSGLAFAAYSGFDIWHHPYRALVTAHSLCYINNAPYPIYTMALYFPAVCGPFLLATDRELRTFGTIVTVGLAGSLAFYFADLVSIWCFFAGLASLCLLMRSFRRDSVVLEAR